jgi:hypothetical protein
VTYLPFQFQEASPGGEVTTSNGPNAPPPASPSPQGQHPQTDGPPSATGGEPHGSDTQLRPAAPGPVTWLQNVDVDTAREALYHCWKAPGSIVQISALGDDGGGNVDDSSRSGSPVSGCVGFSALIDTGAQVNIVTTRTLKSLKRGYSRVASLSPEQQRQLNVVDFVKRQFNVVGIVPLLWFLDGFGEILFSTTFHVIDIDAEEVHDLIIGRDYLDTVHAALDEAEGPQRLRQMVAGLHRFQQRAVHTMRLHPRRSWRNSQHVDDMSNRAGIPSGQGMTGPAHTTS